MVFGMALLRQHQAMADHEGYFPSASTMRPFLAIALSAVSDRELFGFGRAVVEASLSWAAICTSSIVGLW